VIVVTGAAGFIGGHLVAELRARGYHVAGVDRRPGGDHVADLTRDADVLDLLRDAEAVFHLAGAAGVRRQGPYAEATWWRDNVVATEAVLAAVHPATPVVVTSSSSVYGGAAGGTPCHEAQALRPRGGYARSKAEVERRARLRLAAAGQVAIARPFTVAGERQRPDMAIARWLDAARKGQPIRIFGSLTRRRDITDVRDVAVALAEMAARGVTGPVNVGTGVSHTLGELVAAVTATVGPAPLVVERGHRDEVAATLADTTRCRRLVGFVPHTDLQSLVRRQATAAVTTVAATVAAAVPGEP
jgi:nucleoside-diphosphate-sugar epimerase